MALITCKYCGRNISDTTDTCIHCGGKVNENIILEKESSQNAPTVKSTTESKENKVLSEENGTRFKKLSEKCQIDLEEEFLKSNKKILRYRRKGLEIKKFGAIPLYSLLLGRLLYLAQNYVTNNYFNGTVYDQKWIAASSQFLVLLVLTMLFSLIMLIYSAISYRNKVKKIAYQKFFQKWLREEKQIIYHPNLISNKEKQIFDDIDTENFKF